MAGLEDFPHLLHVPAMTRALHTMLQQKREDTDRFGRLPFVALRSDHPWATALPEGVGRLHEVSPTMLGVLVGIDKVLAHGSAQRRIWAYNGNRWAWGQEGEVPYPMLERDGNDPDSGEDNLRVVMVPGLLVPCTLGFPSSLMMSLALRPGRVLRADEPIAVATRIASRFQPVIVAAGNWGHEGDLDTLSPIARLPWCISVGATTDEEGTTLWPGSSVGSRIPPRDPARAASPTLVAHGQNAYVPDEMGTSFAAPVVAGAVGDLTAFLLQVRATRVQADGQMGSCPLLIRGGVDHGFRDFDPIPPQRVPMLPNMGVDVTACNQMITLLEEHGIVDLDPTPSAVTRMLLSCTRPMPGYATHQVGAGFYADSASVGRLLEFTGLDYLDAMFPASSLPPDARARLAQLRLAEPAELGPMLSLARRSGLTFMTDFKTLDEFSSTPPLKPGPNADLLRVDPDPFFWPPQPD